MNHLSYSWPFEGLLLQHTHQQLLYLFGQSFVSDHKLLSSTSLEHFLVVFAHEVRSSMQHFIKDDPQGPDVNRIGIIVILGLLRRDVLFSASQSLHDDAVCREPKISYFNIGYLKPGFKLSDQEDVLGFEIAVSDLVVVEDLDPPSYLHYHCDCVFRLQLIVGHCVQTLEQASTLTVLCDVEDLVLGLLNSVNLQNVGAVHLHQLPIDLFLLLKLFQFLFIDGY